jgi:nitroimidazol reductase NimA-like FMN-containing flavoprotein (pyridoxamine 5'-phosphate oxidase superfamily)
MAGKMTEEEVKSFLDSKPGWMMLTSIGPDEYPHTVPIGYFRDGNRMFMGCRDNTQKVVNIERNPKVSLSLEDGTTMQDIRGVLLRGDAQVVREDEERLVISRLAAKLRGTPESEWPVSVSPGSVFIKLENFNVVSWDYSKPLG